MKDMAHPAHRLPLHRLAYHAAELALFAACLLVLTALIVVWGAPLS